MATEYKDTPPPFDLTNSSQRPASPWRKWMNGSWWHLRKGEDYTMGDQSFRSGFYTRARRWGLKAEMHMVEGGYCARALPREGQGEGAA